MKQTGALIAKVVTLALMRHIQKADGSISGHLGLRTAYLETRPRGILVILLLATPLPIPHVLVKFLPQLLAKLRAAESVATIAKIAC